MFPNLNPEFVVRANPDIVMAVAREIDNMPRRHGWANLKALKDKRTCAFASDRYEDILANLEADDSDWAMKELATLRTKSPQTCKVALRQLATSTDLDDFADNMAMEYRIGSRVLIRPDFAEGVRAVIVDKDNAPRWRPSALADVSDADVERHFAALSDELVLP